MAKVEYSYLKVESFHRNVERYAQNVEYAYFIHQFTGECRTAKRNTHFLKKMGASLHLNIRLL